MHYRRWQRHGSTEILKKRPVGRPCVYINSGGYLVVQAGRVGYPLHRLVAECSIGRPLRVGEIVHHRDGDKLNNAPSNLEVTNRSRHTSQHNRRPRRGTFCRQTETEKECRECGAMKSKTLFHRNAAGLGAECADCRASLAS